MPDSRPFSLGLLVGRFQMLHLGHQYMIDTALAVCGRVGILVGSSQESGTAVNPFPYELRRDMLQELYGDRVEIAPLPDIGVGNTSAWGNYVLQKAREAFGAAPDLVISGAEGRRTSWFQDDSSIRSESGSRYIAVPHKMNPPAELYLPKVIDISASRMRGFLLEDNFAAWSEYTDPRLHAHFPELRALVLAGEARTETASL